ncbi:RES family NAD+ phosphorylase [Teredinibacter turnerae]|uniref:RES family NAD+ phosphorylase n=1 Tax=Teredinibacter turnerae TaxID=2426 RepID=UPI00035ED1A5|nr:RES family NAD+ phosphorylase [Teredinibacter turnerae]
MQIAESVSQLPIALVPLVGLAWRVVETQGTAATRAITRNADEQLRLEQLLEGCKPPVPDACEKLSYLLATPFRYPPLRHGSRYGTRWERGIFYAAQEQETALAETAVYLWLFQQGVVELGPLAEITDARTVFSVRLRTGHGCDLAANHFQHIQAKLTEPGNWEYTQALGTRLRGMGADFFWFPSARLAGGTNVAVVNPESFASPTPDTQQLWNLRLTPELCWFGRADAGRDMSGYFEFSREVFAEAGALAHPCL